MVLCRSLQHDIAVFGVVSFDQKLTITELQT